MLHEGRVTLDRRYFWLDTWAFDALAAEAESAPNSSLENLAERMLELYRGPFLAGDDASWQIPPRERLRSRLARTVDRVMREWQDRGQPARARACYEKCVEIDADTVGRVSFKESVSDR